MNNALSVLTLAGCAVVPVAPYAYESPGVIVTAPVPDFYGHAHYYYYSGRPYRHHRHGHRHR